MLWRLLKWPDRVVANSQKPQYEIRVVAVMMFDLNLISSVLITTQFGYFYKAITRMTSYGHKLHNLNETTMCCFYRQLSLFVL